MNYQGKILIAIIATIAITLIACLSLKQTPLPDEQSWDRDTIGQQNTKIYLQMKGVNEKLSQVIYLLQYQDSLMTEQVNDVTYRQGRITGVKFLMDSTGLGNQLTK